MPTRFLTKRFAILRNFATIWLNMNQKQRVEFLIAFANAANSWLNFRIWVNPNNRLALNLRGSAVEDYIIFYYPRQDGIDVVHIVSGYRDLETLFE